MFRVCVRHNLPRKHAQKECGGVKNRRGGLVTMLNEYFRASVKCESALIMKLKARKSASEFSLRRPWKTVPLWRVLVLQRWIKVQTGRVQFRATRAGATREFLFFFPLLSVSLWSLTRRTHKLINILESTLYHNIPCGRKTATVHPGCATAQLGAL